MAKSDDKNKDNHKPIKRPKVSNTALSWTIRSVEIERRAIILKAAEQAGKTIGKFINEDISTYCMNQLSHTREVSAPKDIQNQIDHLTTIIETISARLPEVGKKSLWKKLFNS